MRLSAEYQVPRVPSVQVNVNAVMNSRHRASAACARANQTGHVLCATELGASEEDDDRACA